MTPEEYARHDALALADLVRTRQVQPRELMELCVGAIDSLNPALNAVVSTTYERAERSLEAGLPAGPFSGVPFLLKDMMDLKGTRMCLGAVLLKDNVCHFTHPLIERMEQAGLVILGRTNMSELGLIPYTESAVHGPGANPWNLEHSPGGSSGGAAAAVAARILPVAAASDGGGSIRIPASACGVFGLKPSRGRNPSHHLDDHDGFIAHHVVSRSVRDSAAMLDATQGSRLEDRWQLPPPAKPYAEIIKRPPRALRIGFTSTDFLDRPAQRECQQAVEHTAHLLESLGHRVEPARPIFDGAEFNLGFKVLWAMSVGHVFKEAHRRIQEEPSVPRLLRWLFRSRWLFNLFVNLPAPGVGKPFIELFTRRIRARFEAKLTPGDVWHAWDQMRVGAETLSLFLNDYDLLLTPTLAEPPQRTGTFNHHGELGALEESLFRYAAYTPLCNASGHPAMSVPLYWSDDGLPIGSHFVAPMGREDRLLQLAAQLEEAQPWAERRPPVCLGGAG